MRTFPLRRLALSGLASFTLATAGCGGGDSTGPSPAPTDLSGSYALTAVRSLGTLHGGGNGMPVTFTDGGGTSLTFNSGTLALAADGSYTLEVAAVFKGNPVTMTDAGTYSSTGNNIAFSPSGDPKRMKNGTVKGNRITATTQFGGVPFEIDVRK